MRYSFAAMIFAAAAATATTSIVEGQSSGDGWLLVANKNDQALGSIDPKAGRQIASVPVGGVTGHEVIASPDGRKAYVPIFGNSGVGKPGTDGQHIAVVDLASKSVEKTFAFVKGVRPHHPL